MRVQPPCANIPAMNDSRNNEEDLMLSTSTFFIETAIIAGISPLNADVAVRQPRARRAIGSRPAPMVSDPEDRYVDELLATFSDRWEW
jgi:hypothetical protein